MKILIACEFTQIITNEFRERGHDAYSCDIIPTEGNPDFHIQDNVLRHLNENWDMMIAHPPCTFLCNSGVHWLSKDPDRWDKLQLAAEFFNRLAEAPISKICIENPIPHKYAKQKLKSKYRQIIQPYQYGHGEQKATCLWLKNLPMLHHTSNTYDWDNLQYKNIITERKQRIANISPGPNRSKERSRTYTGIAKAMALQWGEDYN